MASIVRMGKPRESKGKAGWLKGKGMKGEPKGKGKKGQPKGKGKAGYWTPGGDAPGSSAQQWAQPFAEGQFLHSPWPTTFNALGARGGEIYDFAMSLGCRFRIKGRATASRTTRPSVLTIKGPDTAVVAVIWKELVRSARVLNFDLSRARSNYLMFVLVIFDIAYSSFGSDSF